MENVYNVKKLGWREILEPIKNEIKGMSVSSKKVLAQAIIYSGMKGELEKGMFFRSNKDYANDCGIDSASLRWSLGTLDKKGYLKREEIGDRKNGASTYRLRADLLALNPLVEESSSPILNNSYNTLNNSYNIINISDNILNNEEKILDKTELKLEEKTDNNIKIDSIEIMKKEEEIEKPRNLKELGDFFKNKVISKAKECETSEELLKLKDEIEEELEEYQYISSYKNCLYSINDYFNRKIEDFQIKGILV